MNFSDFKRLLGADPYSQDPEFLRARESGPEYIEATRAADEFEHQLKQVLAIDAPATLEEDILRQVYAQPRRPISAWPLALAASVIMAIGAAGVFFWQRGPVVDVPTFVANHYSHDGLRLVQQATTPADPEHIQAIMDSVNLHAAAEFAEEIYYIKNCPTPDGTGAHLVLMTAEGPVTVYYMPRTSIDSASDFEMGGLHALLVALPQGSAAVIGPSLASVRQISQQLGNNLLPGRKIPT